MGSYGLFPEGFVPARTADIRAELEEGYRDEFGRSQPVGDSSLAGFLIGIISERLGIAWEILDQIYGAMDPNKAIDDLLRVVCSLTGTFEVPASSSTVVETLCGDDGTVVPAGKIVSTSSTGKRFTTFADATLVALAAWIPATAYVLGDRVTNGGNCFICTIAGISDVAGGPLLSSPPVVDIIDNTVHWAWFGTGAAAVDVQCTSEDLGEVVAVAGDLTVIETPLGGWNTATNLLDAKPGREKMTNQQLRLLREAELAQPGSGTKDAIRAALLAIDGVTAATVFFNNTDLVDADGLTPHSCEALVEGGDDQVIANVLWANVPIGILTKGTTPATVTDAEGLLQPVNFSRPTPVNIYVDITLSKLPKSYGGDAAVQAAIAVSGAELREIGDDVVASMVGGWVFASVPGVKDIPLVKIGTAPAPAGSATIVIDARHRAVFDTTRVTVHSTDDTP